MEDIYKPISCHFYDELESAATKKILNTIKYEEYNGEIVTTHDFISNFETYKGSEYMVLKDKGSIRLDKIVSFNGLNSDAYN